MMGGYFSDVSACRAIANHSQNLRFTNLYELSGVAVVGCSQYIGRQGSVWRRENQGEYFIEARALCRVTNLTGAMSATRWRAVVQTHTASSYGDAWGSSFLLMPTDRDSHKPSLTHPIHPLCFSVQLGMPRTGSCSRLFL